MSFDTNVDTLGNHPNNEVWEVGNFVVIRKTNGKLFSSLNYLIKNKLNETL